MEPVQCPNLKCVCVFRNSVRLVIRKVQYAPEKPGPQPMVETTRSFLMSDRSLHLEASLDKEVHTHARTRTHTENMLLLNNHSFICLCFLSCIESSCITMENPSASTSTSPTTPPKQSKESRSLVCLCPTTSVLPVRTCLSGLGLILDQK